MMEAVRTSETSVDNYFTRQYNPEDSSEHHTRRRENLKSRIIIAFENPSSSAGLEPANFWSNGKHSNRYTTNIHRVSI
jgi:hypothetical protein